MEAISGILIGVQLVLSVIMGVYFFSSLKSGRGSNRTTKIEADKELYDLRRLRGIKLTEPLSEKTRPTGMDEIVGQGKGVKALMAALCGPNPQHVIIYGPPGVGKTAAARIVLDYARKSRVSPFAAEAPFIEIDATILQFDERGIADPLMGSVHDPIYQGAGAYGAAGVPQPRPGAVTKAHGGVLFIDEIGELHSVQMNRLLKVLEDRKVFLSSSYYSKENTALPKHIHDIFKNGLPADFRLVGATTRGPEDIPPALRSRCTEIFFRPLNSAELAEIAKNACKKAGFGFDERVPRLIANYSENGRDAVNIVQTSASVAAMENRNTIGVEDVEEVAESGRYSRKPEKTLSAAGKVGVANGIGVYGEQSGTILEIEAVAELSKEKGGGLLKATGIVEEEELNGRFGKMRRTSSAKSSLENALTVLRKCYGINAGDYNIHVNFPGVGPVDGPSAGTAVFAAVFSALTNVPVPGRLAMTGEITLKGKISAVGGILTKVEAAAAAGAETVIVPKANYQKGFENLSVKVICAETTDDVLRGVFGADILKITHTPNVPFIDTIEQY